MFWDCMYRKEDKLFLHGLVDGSRANLLAGLWLYMEDIRKCQGLHSLIRIVICTGIRREYKRNCSSGGYLLSGCFSFVVQARFTVLLLFFLIVEAKDKKTKSYAWCWIFHKILACFHMHSFHSDPCKKIVEYILKERNTIFFLS